MTTEYGELPEPIAENLKLTLKISTVKDSFMLPEDEARCHQTVEVLIARLHHI